MNFKNIKIRTRLLTGFSTIGILVFALGWLAVFQTKSIWQDASNLYNHPFKVNIAVREIETGITAMHRSLKDVILSGNRYEMSKYLNLIDRDEESVKRNFQVVYDQYLGSKSTIDSAYATFIKWKEIRDTTILLCQEGKMQEAAYRTTHAGEAYSDEIMASVNRLKDFAMQKAAGFYSSAEQNRDILQLQLFILIGVILSLIAVIGYYILKAITFPIKELIGASEAHRKGDYSARCLLESSNEMGQLAVSFNRMALGIESEINIKTGISAISDSMLGKEKFEEFGKSLIGAILTHTSSNIGAIYFLNEEAAMFEPKFAVGLQKNQVKSFSANLYEGEFGRTLLEKKITLIGNIPNDTIFHFSAVTGTFKPKEIINIPILLNDKVIAIISLANLNPFSKETLEMLKIAEKSLTAGIISILAVEKIREYSQMVNEQNTELGMQSKELILQKEECRKGRSMNPTG
jgi:CHASE3 domain sensor protein